MTEENLVATNSNVGLNLFFKIFGWFSIFTIIAELFFSGSINLLLNSKFDESAIYFVFFTSVNFNFLMLILPVLVSIYIAVSLMWIGSLSQSNIKILKIVAVLLAISSIMSSIFSLLRTYHLLN